MCVHGAKNTRNDLKPFKEMDMGLYQRIINELQDWPGPRLKLLRLTMLGEPLLNKNLPAMVKLAKEADITECIDFFSNGSILTPELSERLIDAGLDRIRFSLYAIDDKRHRDVTKQNKFTPAVIFDNIKKLRGIRDAKKSRTPYIIVKMFDSYNDENDRFLSMYNGVADETGIEKVHNATRYSGNDLIGMFYNDSELVKKTEDAFDKNLRGLEACPRPFMALCIDSLGNVLMCTHDAPRHTKIADLNKTTLQDIWFGDALYEFRKMQLEGRLHENKICAKCDWYKVFPQTDSVDGFPVEKLKYLN
jgi:radical SAM protein with 4Fe4S-binding SPASM domain